MNMINLTISDDGVAVASIDQSGRSMNVLNDELMHEFLPVIERLETDKAIKGLVLTSGKADFLAGADIDRLQRIASATEALELTGQLHALLRRLEKCGKPVVAALTGKVFGGGLELALACHHRIALNHDKLRLGLPEVKLGLLPGGGGTQRLPRLVGIQTALQMMCEGESVRGEKALQMGLIGGLASNRDELISQAQAWCLAHPEAQQPWDRKGFKWPGGDPKSPAMAQMLAIGPSVASAKSWGNYPALTHIMSCVFEGSLLNIDNALQVEARYFAACVMSQESRNMIGTLWYQLRALEKGQSRPVSVPSSQVKKLGVLGAGMMGAGIAYVAAKTGMEVVLLDSTLEKAQQGKQHSQDQVNKAVSRGHLTADQRDAMLARILPTTSYNDLAGCDLVVEAVFEDRAIKADVTRHAEACLGAHTVLASNTSTLPITSLAQASKRPANFLGLHFFSPVEKMPLVEIIVGASTSNETLARGFDFVRQIGKTPIVVNDSRGFYTSRVFATYLMEGMAMLHEGVHPRSIEVAGLQAGMPMPPLALQDEVSLSLSLHVMEQTRKDLQAEGVAYVSHPGEAVIHTMAREHERFGKKAGKGFYDYPDTDKGSRKSLWSGLARLYPPATNQPSQQELIDRLMFAQANEAAKCFQEGIVRSVADANIGSIFGWGFAPFHGGALQFINALGARRFVARAHELASRYGARFEPAAIVVQHAETGATFND